MEDLGSNCRRPRAPTVGLAVAVLVGWLGGCWSSQPAAPPVPTAAIASRPAQTDTAVDELLAIVRERLLLMHEVAKWKWNSGKPITDPDRERQLLANLEQRGLSYGLTREQTRKFMAAQVEAGKLMQGADFARWKDQSHGKFDDGRNLNTELRPIIDELSDRMLAQFGKVVPAIDDEQSKAKIKRRADEIVRGDGIDDTVRRAVIRPLLEGLAQ